MITRTLEGRLLRLLDSYPVVFLTGPRQSGKTTLARTALPGYAYISLEDVQRRRDAIDDPRGFLSGLQGAGGVVLDEVQRAPDLFSYIQGVVDEQRGGPFVLTGSQNFLLSERVGQTLAGRAAVLELMPFSLAELEGRPAITPDVIGRRERVPPSPSRWLDEVLVTGMFPPIHDRNLEAPTWLDGYVRTYVERDVRLVTNVTDLDAFSRFVSLCAGRSGQLLNMNSLASDAGVAHTTARRWLSILRASYVVELLPPHHRSFRKRLVKSPKLYFLDTGLLCFLLGIRDAQVLRTHPLRGAIFESFVVSELRKSFLHHGVRPTMSFWRDSNGTEVDVVIEAGNELLPIEVKAGATPTGDMTKSLESFMRLSGARRGVLFYGGDEAYERRGVSLRPWWTCS